MIIFSCIEYKNAAIPGSRYEAMNDLMRNKRDDHVSKKGLAHNEQTTHTTPSSELVKPKAPRVGFEPTIRVAEQV